MMMEILKMKKTILREAKMMTNWIAINMSMRLRTVKPLNLTLQDTKLPKSPKTQHKSFLKVF